ncbi:MAG: cyclic nucleotide-binding domain-containing protein [Deltaproteobacteria bacterium]|nr:cyclic nucleotide-binding domain-containing protein [Kofleriaceae bacterium]
MANAWRFLASRLLAAGPAGACDRTGHAARAILVNAEAEPLDLVTRLELLRHGLPFPSGYIQAVAALAVAAHEERLPVGTRVQRAGEVADTVTVVIDGVGHVVEPAPAFGEKVLPGQSLGRLETLARAPYAVTVEALTPLRVLRVPLPALLDIMEDHTDFAMALTTQLATGVLALERGAPPVRLN